jgi:DNA helicase II / ATP-dependent DNA helicase PcrA
MPACPQTFQILDTQDQLSAIKRLSSSRQCDDERYPPKQPSTSSAAQGRRPAPRRCGGARRTDRKKVGALRAVRRTVPARRRGRFRRADAALATSCCATTTRSCASTTSGASGISWSTSSRTPTACSTRGSRCSARRRWRLTPSGNAVFAVGDDDQSIYAFRGARVGNMADFVREFRVQHQIKLEQNYRSVSNILDSANALISHNTHAWARTCAPTRARASRCACLRPPATSPKRSGWWTR